MTNTTKHPKAAALTAWLEKNQISIVRFAQMLDVSPAAVSHWLNGRSRPSAACAHRVAQVTHGAVSLHDQRPDIWP
jgi:DNA-binding transcriptional regulator YdaS (Cro superfamily)